MEGLPTRAGSRRALPERWQREGFLVRTLRSLGAVIVGKTHTVEFAFGGRGPESGRGHAGQSLGRRRAPGAGRVVVRRRREPLGGIGAAGSGLRHGRLDPHPGVGYGRGRPAPEHGTLARRRRGALESTLDTVGLLARTARPALGLRGHRRDGGAGRGDGGRHCAVRRKRRGGPADRRPRIVLRLGALGARVVATVRRALDELEAAGATLLDMDLPSSTKSAGSIWRALSSRRSASSSSSASCRNGSRSWTRGRPAPEGRQEHGRGRLRARSAAPAARLGGGPRQDGFRARGGVGRADASRRAAHGRVPFAVGRLSRSQPAGCCRAQAQPACWTCAPSASRPASIPQGMPAGLQLVGRNGADRALLAVAAAVEAALGDAPARLGTPPRLGSVPPSG